MIETIFRHEQVALRGDQSATASSRWRTADYLLDKPSRCARLQSKLLRVLQEGEFEPVGSAQTRKVDVRVIAATNRDLEKSVREGKFREDLYYRLNVFPLQLPPLRERTADIALLATAFAQKYAQSIGRALEPLSEDCLRRLQAYNWPGNVRERKTSSSAP